LELASSLQIHSSKLTLSSKAYLSRQTLPQRTLRQYFIRFAYSEYLRGDNARRHFTCHQTMSALPHRDIARYQSVIYCKYWIEIFFSYLTLSFLSYLRRPVLRVPTQG